MTVFDVLFRENTPQRFDLLLLLERHVVHALLNSDQLAFEHVHIIVG